MDIFYISFPDSGVSTWIFIPPLVAFVISFFTSMAGVSGAFALLPFQMSVLNYTAPSVSSTNQLFNIIAIPSGVWQYVKEKRMVWSLTWAVIIGTLPGVIIGAWLRLEFLPAPGDFKFFAGFVLLYIGIKLVIDIVKTKQNDTDVGQISKSSGKNHDFKISKTLLTLKQVEFSFNGEEFSFSPLAVFLLCFFVGIIGGVYGIGGGAIIAPFFVAFLHLPVYAIAGAALMGTFVTSVAGVIVYQILASYYPELSVAPDWYLGILFGIGGFFGMYLGAKCQKYVSAFIIKLILCVCILFVAAKYIIDFI